VQGATPLFMLDYLATGKLRVNEAVEVIKGIVAGCQEAECSLIGGETAEMPDFYPEGEYDLAGFVVGIADNSQIIDGSEIGVGNHLIGIASSGLHSNGYSLARRIFFDHLKMSVHDYVEDFGRTLGEELLEPTKIFVRTIKNITREFRIHGMAHITGGGLIDNLPRILPDQCKVVINTSSWTPPPIFQYLQNHGKLTSEEMMRTFNNGLGLVMVVNKENTDEILSRLKGMGHAAFHIGIVEPRDDKEKAIQFVS
jgi:phosphoribosylformylglycinamidine cyclo-ligase